jgi:hypothetical protein
MTEALELVIREASTVASSALPEFLGKLETARVTALARLSAPAPAKVTALDKLLPTVAAAERLGVSVHYLRRHPEQLRHLERPIGR